jgi:hypothetical protein
MDEWSSASGFYLVEKRLAVSSARVIAHSGSGDSLTLLDHASTMPQSPPGG